jgi:glycosyltransferase involved in cell wall biosynthesis
MPTDAITDRPPRVLYCTDTYPPQVNGVSVVTALSIAGLRARGWETSVIASRYPESLPDPFDQGKDPTQRERIVGVANVPLPIYPDIQLAAPDIRTVVTEVRRFRPDLVHCATKFVLGRGGQWSAMRAGIPVVSSYHTDFGRYAAEYGAAWLRRPVTQYIARFHARSRRIFTPSAPARQDLPALGLTNVEVWGCGVDTETFHPSRRSAPLRDAYGGRDTCIFLHGGRLAAEQGVERILEAYRRARAQVPNGSMHLVIAGAGPKDAELRAAAPEGVTFLGNLDRHTVLPRLYASCDAFLFSSLTETLGLVILEAMASELPVIATPAGGVAEHLYDGLNGIAYPPRDIDALTKAMVSVVLDRSRLKHLAAGARATADRLSWDAELDRLDAIYRDVCGMGVRTPSDVLATATVVVAQASSGILGTRRCCDGSDRRRVAMRLERG